MRSCLVAVRRFCAGALASTLVLAGVSGEASALTRIADPDRLAAFRAVEWLRTQQEADGGFELADFAGFETPEAALAIAAAAQRTDAWSAMEALAAVREVSSSTGLTALDYLDDFAEGRGDDAISGGTAAKLIALVTGPLCLDARAFDPQRDGPVDLFGRVEDSARPDGAYGPEGVFSDTLYAVLAFRAVGSAIRPATVDYIRAAQEADGGWNFAGSSDEQGFDDVDTTALAVQALLAAGAAATDASIVRALDYLQSLQNADGSWSFFGSPDPNATAVGTLAFAAAGRAVTHDAKGWLRSQQESSGRIAGAFPNTYATTQTVRALLDVRLPVEVAAGTCAGDGYELFAADGGVFTYGRAAFAGSAGSIRLNSPIVSGAETRTGRGYFLFARDGGVFTYGDAQFRGSAAGRDNAIVAGAVEPQMDGYRLFSASGTVWYFAEGGAGGFRPGPTRLNAPIVAAAITPTRNRANDLDSRPGDVLFAADGGVFTSANAPFLGSMGGTTLNAPIVGGAITSTGRGYLMFAADGGVFTFGDARFSGSMGGTKLNSPIVGGASSLTGRGYALFAADGGVFTFGDVGFTGSAGSLTLNSPVVAGALD